MGKGDWDVLRGDISNLLLALSATSKRPLEYLLSFLGGISPRTSVFLFTASAWPEQVLSGADRTARAKSSRSRSGASQLRSSRPREFIGPGLDGAPAEIGSKMAALKFR